MNYHAIIFEGASTSGKTVLIEKIKEMLELKNIPVFVVDEKRIVSPDPGITESTSKSLNNLMEILEECAGKGKVVLFDRFHISRIAITNGSFQDYAEIELRLKEMGALIIFLRLDESEMIRRLDKAVEHRNSDWKKHLEEKGHAWFPKTQGRLLEELKKSNLPSVIIDTTSGDYNKIANQIVEKYIMEQ